MTRQQNIERVEEIIKDLPNRLPFIKVDDPDALARRILATAIVDSLEIEPDKIVELLSQCFKHKGLVEKWMIDLAQEMSKADIIRVKG